MENNVETDVLIAGGGPAGLSAAEAAARAGARAIVLEQGNEIGSPTRTSGGSFVSELQKLGVPEDLYHVVHRCRFVAPANEAEVTYERPNLCVMDVRRTYQWQAEGAISAGASIRLATQVLDPVLSSSGTVVGANVKTRTSNETISSQVLIDATGYRSAISKKAGLHQGFERFGVGAEYDLFAPHYDEREAVLIVGGSVAPCGYAWFLPYGKHRVRAGVGVIHKDSAADPVRLLDGLVSKASSLRVNLRGAQPVEYHFGLIPSAGLANQYAGDGILAAGDAAGQASCLVGEGIRWAMLAGRMAGEVAAECVQSKNVSAQALGKYEARWRTAFGRNLRIAYEINRRIASWSDDDWNRRTEFLKLLTADEFDQALRTDFSAAWAAKVALAHPGVVKQGLLSLIHSVTL